VTERATGRRVHAPPTQQARPNRPAWWVDATLIAMLLPLAVVAHRPGYLFSHSFWLDEGWVADSVRAPFHQLRLLTSSTPVGWTLLLRLVPDVGPPERLRVLPLAFGVLSVVAAYLLGRRLGRVAAVAAGLAAALAPTALSNHSLKQYSADVFVTLLLLWLTERLEAGWSQRRLAALCLVCCAAAGGAAAGAAVVIGAGVLLVPAAYAGAMEPMPQSTVRQQVSYVLSHRRPGDVVVVGWAASFMFAYYWPERPTFAPTTIPTAVLFQVEYPGRGDLVLVRRWRRPELIHGALGEAASRSRSGRVWLVLAEAGDGDRTWNQAMGSVGQIARRPLPRPSARRSSCPQYQQGAGACGSHPDRPPWPVADRHAPLDGKSDTTCPLIAQRHERQRHGAVRYA
jgi:hypothetical protein